MLEITGDDIAALNDAVLRTLIGKLCEAELTAQNLPVAGVTWSGHQNAPDGGVDVRVDITASPHPDSFIPRANTAFQVKKSDMPRGEIIKEMKPNGQLRDEFKTLADKNGAYIIVSAQGSTADSALKNRIKAMKEALAELPNHTDIKTDFYDRGRVASWVRSHPAMILWLRNKLGRPIQGWQPFGCWTGRQADMDNEYLCDDHIRLFKGSKTSKVAEMTGLAGIQAMRKILAKPRASIRLTGLSGVGKTRLLQALFDEKIGANPLSQTRVFYTDIGDNPIPDPKSVAQQLIGAGHAGILAVDNCRPELHDKLTSTCSVSNSKISLITVEYDVQDDQPDDTDVFRLEPASDKLIEDMLLAMFSAIDDINARTIAHVAGGNARIAIALAKTVEKGEDLSSLKNRSLFNRLFQQQHEVDKDLLKAAEVCALVYSFDATTEDGKNHEMQLLSTLAQMTVTELHGHTSELDRRELVQQRDIWRAVLPQALANWLAKDALQNIPLDKIRQTLEQGPQRLLISFSKRLRYLHQSNEAKEVVNHWLADEGLLGNIGDLDYLGTTLLNNIGPVDPPAVLAAIERATTLDTNGQIFLISKATEIRIDYSDSPTDGFNKLSNILQSIAYDETLFPRAIHLLLQFTLVEQTKKNNYQIKNQLKSLFYLYLSGTHASAEQRLEVIKPLIAADNAAQTTLAFELLDAALEAWHFSATRSFEFGGWPRDRGYRPKTHQDVIDWYRLFIEFTVTQAIAAAPRVSKPAKTLLAKKFKGLWIKAGMLQTLTAAVTTITANAPWQEGWAAVKETQATRAMTLSDENKNQLNTLAERLEPLTLIEQIRCYALSHGLHTQSPANHKQAYETEAQALGQALVQDEALLQQHLTEILSNDDGRYTNSGGLDNLGQGMATGCSQPAALWQNLKQAISHIDPAHIQWELLRGFLWRTTNLHPAIVNTLLDEAVEDSVLAQYFPQLQNYAYPLPDAQAVNRLKLSLEVGAAAIEQYIPMTHKIVSDKDFCDILRHITAKDTGVTAAIAIAYNRVINSNVNKQTAIAPDFVQLGQALLLAYIRTSQNIHANYMDYELSRIIYACCTGEDAKTTATEICRDLDQLFGYDRLRMNNPDLLKSLSTTQPVAFLEGFLTPDSHRSRMVVNSPDEHDSRDNPFDSIDDDTILNWCDSDPSPRYPLIAAVIVPYQKDNNDEALTWTPLARKIMTKAPTPVVVLKSFKVNFMPTTWSDSLAEIMQIRLPLLSALKTAENPLIAQWASDAETEFTADITKQREQESQKYDRRNATSQGFE